MKGGIFLMSKKIKYLISALFVLFVVIIMMMRYQFYNKDEAMHVLLEDTYRYFDDHTNRETGLTRDRIDIEENDVKTYNQTSPTNIAMYLSSLVIAAEAELINYKEAEEKTALVLNTLDSLDRWNGLFYNWYVVDSKEQMSDWGKFISSVDNGWLTAALMVSAEYFYNLESHANDLINQMDYSYLYDNNIDRLYGGFDVEQNQYTNHHYGTLYSETRMASYVAIGKGDVPSDHWWKLDRTAPEEFDWQRQVPKGKFVEKENTQMFQGYYELGEERFVPSWGGSMFEALMPGLYINEKKLAEKGLGANNYQHVKLQQNFSEQKGYPLFGFSPAAIPDGYSEFGVEELGMSGYDDQATMTAHAAILAIDYDDESVKNSFKIMKEKDMYGDYGLYDSINLLTEEVTHSYLALDQGMIILALGNYLYNDIIRVYFHSHPYGKNAEPLLEEDFLLQIGN